MKIGCCISLKQIASAKELSYDFVELAGKEIAFIPDAQWKDVLHNIQKIHIPVIGFNAFSDKSISLVGPNFDLEKNLIYFQTILERGADLGIRSIGIGSPQSRNVPDDFPYETAKTQFCTFIQKAVQLSKKHGIYILCEALHPYGCNFGNHTIEIYDMVQRINDPFLGIVWDIYHAFVAGESFAELETCFKKVQHIHICGWDHDRHRFFITEKDSSRMNSLFAFLQEHHYQHSISVEASPDEFDINGTQSIEVLSQLRKDYAL